MGKPVGLGSAVLLIASLVACAPGTTSGGDPCAADDVPCSLSDVEPQVLTRMIDLGQEAYEEGRRGTWGDVAAFLDEQDDVVDVTLSATQISYRVDGAPRSYLLSPLAARIDLPATPDTADADVATSTYSGGSADAIAPAARPAVADEPAALHAPAAHAPALLHAPAVLHAPPTTSNRSVVPAGSGARLGSNAKKRALILEPYGPEGVAPVAADLAATLRDLGEYDVDYYGDVGSWPEGFDIFTVLTNLDSYDLVYITSHGSQGGFSVQNARPWYVQDPATGLYSIPDDVQIPAGIGTSRGPDGKLRFFVTTEFIENQYPQGLKDTLIYGDWCQSAMGEDFRDAIMGDGSVFVGWDQSVGVDQAARAARLFWEAAVEWGLDTADAHQYVVDQGEHYQPPVNILTQGIVCTRQGFSCGDRYDSTLHVFAADRPVRAVSTVTSYQDGERVTPGIVLEWSGDLDDGIPDTIDRIRITVRGLSPSRAPEGQVVISIDGRPLSVRIPVADMPVVATDGASWEEREIVLTDLLLPFDVTEQLAAGYLRWEVRVVDPTSSDVVEQVGQVRLAGAWPNVSVVHPETFHRLGDGDDVMVAGAEGDGTPDRTSIAVEVGDVGPDVAGQYFVEVVVSGGTLTGQRRFSWALNVFRHLGQNRWRHVEPLPLDIDLTDSTRPLTIDARVFRTGSSDVLAAHSPTVRLRGETETVCSAHLTVTGDLTHYDETHGVSYSAPATPDWWPTFDGGRLDLYPPGNPLGRSPVAPPEMYTFWVDVTGIEPGQTGTFTRPAQMMWISHLIDPVGGTNLVAYGDVTLDVTEHRVSVVPSSPTPEQTDLIRGTLSGTLSETGGPDDTGTLDVHATFDFSVAGCYPGSVT